MEKGTNKPKKHLFLKIFLSLIVLFILLTGILGLHGFLLYRQEVDASSIEKSVSAYTEKEGYLPYEEIDEDFVHAVVSVEDKRFFTRKGFDFIALVRALYANIRAGKFIEGGSTITQQIAKNLFLDWQITRIEEKIAEVYLSFDLENTYSKEELFALYANMNYYGDGFWGLRDAAKGYFDHSASDLTLAEAAILAGIPNAPAIYQLSTGYELAKERQSWVLSTMVRNKYISEEEMNQAENEELNIIVQGGQ